MQKITILITFIPWILFFLSVSINAIKDLNKNKITKEWFRDNFLNIFHFDNIILVIIFTFFSYFYPDASQIWLVRVLLFSFINLYLYLNRYYDKNNKKEKITSKDLPIILILLFLMLIPIIYYISTRRYLATYYIMFIFSFFNYGVVIISKWINNKLFELLK